MRVISLKRLREFWEKHPDSEFSLRAWYRVVRKASWASISQVRKAYPHVDAVNLECGVQVTIFNVRGNNYRLAVTISYEHFQIYVKRVMTHREYSPNRWQEKICHEQQK
jgi:mRNA interferase HigB